MFRERSLEPNYPDKIEIDIEEYYSKEDKIENLERILFYIKDELQGWDTEKPEDWKNILSEIQRYIKEMEEL